MSRWLSRCFVLCWSHLPAWGTNSQPPPPPPALSLQRTQASLKSLLFGMEAWHESAFGQVLAPEFHSRLLLFSRWYVFPLMVLGSGQIAHTLGFVCLNPLILKMRKLKLSLLSVLTKVTPSIIDRAKTRTQNSRAVLILCILL